MNRQTPSNDAPLDQTWFMADSALIDKQEMEDQPTPAKTSQKKLYLLAIFGLLAAFVLGGLMLVVLFRPKQTGNNATPTAIEEAAAPMGPLERQLEILKNDIETADPLDSALSFPPVDFKLGLQDATVLQQR